MKTGLSSQKGLSLVELMVATAIGLLLMAGIHRVYISSDTSYRYNEQLSRLQENGRFLADIFGREIRMAGYQGCSGDNFQNLLYPAHQALFTYNFAVAVEGFEATSASQWDSGAENAASLNANYGISDAVGNSDILVVRGPDSDIGRVLSTSPDTSASLDIPDNTGIQTKDIVMAVNCPDAALFAVINVTPGAAGKLALVHNTGAGQTPGNERDFSSAGLSFPAGSEVYRNVTTIYYVRDKDPGAGVSPSLYRKQGTAPVEELVEGVESLQVLYGEDTNSDRNIDNYVTADAVVDWANVVAVRIGMLLRSPGEIGKKSFDSRLYTVNGTAIDPLGNGTPAAPVDDRRLRQISVTTVGIRNRLP